MKSWTVFAIFLLLGTIGPTSPRPVSQAQSHVEPVLINTCLITNDVKALTAFYSQVLQIEPHKSGDDYVEFPTKAGTLALFAARAQEKYIPGSATPGQNHSSILEFRVDDVDEEYARLRRVVTSWVKGPTTQPWGTRSIYLRDPDGNLVDLYTPPVAK